VGFELERPLREEDLAGRGGARGDGAEAAAGELAQLEERHFRSLIWV
jgi:hypothetical protein